jgi:hypothetical protein
MVKKVKLKTTQNNGSVSAYLNSIEPQSLRKNGKTLAKVFKAATGAKPKMWGSSIVGYGQYRYFRANGDEGEFMATGFSMRKSGPVLYIMPGYNDYSQLMEKLGPHKLGKSCLYLKSLEEIDIDVVTKLIKAGIKDLQQKYKVII